MKIEQESNSLVDEIFGLVPSRSVNLRQIVQLFGVYEPQTYRIHSVYIVVPAYSECALDFSVV